jgi:hypothetical protein
MGDDSKLIWRIKQQIRRFANRVSDGLHAPHRRLVSEMLYGIQASEDVKVSNVARSLNERIALIKTENRLCRNLASVDLTDHVNRFLCWHGANQVRRDTVLAVDLGDVSKPYARKMEHLARVRDGSKGELSSGYWLCEIVAADVDGEQITPLYGELYSAKAEHFISENDQLIRAMEMVRQACPERGIVAIDRGGDRPTLFKYLIDNKMRFVIRVNDKRPLLLGAGKSHSARRAAGWCKPTIERTIEVERDGRHERRTVHLGAIPVHLPAHPRVPLWLVVIRGLVEHPILLLTNVSPTKDREHAVWIMDVYLTRWKADETYRWLKQSYNLEDLRVRSYTAIRNLYALVHAVGYFVSVVIGARARMSLVFKKVCEKAKRFYEIANFFQYAVADGIHRLLFGSRTGPLVKTDRSRRRQMLFRFARPPG